MRLELVAAADDRTASAVADVRFRKVGLAVSTLVVTLFAALLYLKIRQIDGIGPALEE